MRVLGITGGIGSGKSYICHLLSDRLNIPVYDCDAAAKRLNEENAEVRAGLTRLVGSHAYVNGRLNRPAVAAYLFASKEHQQQINSLIHPVVIHDFREWMLCQQALVVGIESAILYESGFDSLVDSVLLVAAPEEVRIERAIVRDNATREQILRRIDMQQVDWKDRHPTYIINNVGTTDEMLLKTLHDIIEKETKK